VHPYTPPMSRLTGCGLSFPLLAFTLASCATSKMYVQLPGSNTKRGPHPVTPLCYKLTASDAGLGRAVQYQEILISPFRKFRVH